MIAGPGGCCAKGYGRRYRPAGRLIVDPGGQLIVGPLFPSWSTRCPRRSSRAVGHFETPIYLGAGPLSQVPGQGHNTDAFDCSGFRCAKPLYRRGCHPGVTNAHLPPRASHFRRGIPPHVECYQINAVRSILQLVDRHQCVCGKPLLSQGRFRPGCLQGAWSARRATAKSTENTQ